MNHKKQRIVELLEKRGESLYPRQIAKDLGLEQSTTRGYLRQLSKDGLIFCLEGGLYCSKTTYGLVHPLRVHNVRFRVTAPYLIGAAKIEDDDEVYGALHLWIRYGRKRGLVAGGLSCDLGMDQQHILMATRRFYELVEGKTGHKVDDFTVTTFEANRDYAGKRLDDKNGLGCYTVQSWENFIDRIYQKDESTVRVETKCSKETSLEQFFDVLGKGDIGHIRDVELWNKMRESIDQMTVALKFQNKEVIGLGGVVKSLAENQTGINKEFLDLKQIVSEAMKALSENTKALTELIAGSRESKGETRRPGFYG